MWHTATFVIVLICLLLFSGVKGSCLEYGHSCWGAHGKRSGATAGNANKILRAAVNLRPNDLGLLNEDGANRLGANKYDNFEELNTSGENLPRLITSGEDLMADSNDSTKYVNFRAQRRGKFVQPNNSNKNNLNKPVEEHQQQQQLQQQRKYAPQHLERWRKLPLFGLRPRATYGNGPSLTPVTRNTENELLQQFEQAAANGIGPGSRRDDAIVYYDF